MDMFTGLVFGFVIAYIVIKLEDKNKEDENNDKESK